MQLLNSDETVVTEEGCSKEVEIPKKSKVLEGNLSGDNADHDSDLDVSGKCLDLSIPNGSEDSVEGLYVYKNVFNLIPRWLGGLRSLKTLKFFGNELNLFPTEFRNLVELECLQVKISSPSLSGLPLHNLKSLKELELCKVPSRPSSFPLLSEIAALKCLTKLSVCHFSIR
ncbi:hypothetical protein U1Q18_031351 [Sarracenia purpurea var. burkii]